jgi:hypothetical protein
LIRSGGHHLLGEYCDGSVLVVAVVTEHGGHLAVVESARVALGDSSGSVVGNFDVSFPSTFFGLSIF